ncbi:MAG: UDP-N-acetylmuramate--L-alanine ligase [Myxococcota bacterium]|nr:UDP-N-acetylmuramate--L-alanine ligase [Myxococcota bacterium]
MPQGSLIHLSGIGGSAMSGLALVLRQRGFAVQGTDPNVDTVRPRLEAQGIAVFSEQDGRHLCDVVGLVIATAAMSDDHPELRAAADRGLAILRYAQALGLLTAQRDTVAVAGTHGKTTTASMAIWILRSAGQDPGFVIGGTVRGLEQSARLGEDRGFVAEACEYQRSFLELLPKRAIITNIEADHLDVYSDVNEIQEAFVHFARRLGPKGLLIYCADCERASQVAAATDCRTVSYGFGPSAELRAEELEFESTSTAFSAVWHGENLGRFTVRQLGRHNVANALAASLSSEDMGVPLGEALSHLASFPGAHRRFELLGQARGIAVVDDYAHHPTELKALLEAARQRFEGRRIVCAFQPHQSSRTRLLLADFASVLRCADLALLIDIYTARDSEAETKAVSTEALQRAIVDAGGQAHTVGSLEAAHEGIAAHLSRGDAVLCVGAGPMDTVAAALLEYLAR